MSRRDVRHAAVSRRPSPVPRDAKRARPLPVLKERDVRTTNVRLLVGKCGSQSVVRAAEVSLKIGDLESLGKLASIGGSRIGRSAFAIDNSDEHAHLELRNVATEGHVHSLFRPSCQFPVHVRRVLGNPPRDGCWNVTFHCHTDLALALLCDHPVGSQVFVRGRPLPPPTSALPSNHSGQAAGSGRLVHQDRGPEHDRGFQRGTEHDRERERDRDQQRDRRSGPHRAYDRDRVHDRERGFSRDRNADREQGRNAERPDDRGYGRDRIHGHAPGYGGVWHRDLERPHDRSRGPGHGSDRAHARDREGERRTERWGDRGPERASGWAAERSMGRDDREPRERRGSLPDRLGFDRSRPSSHDSLAKMGETGRVLSDVARDVNSKSFVPMETDGGAVLNGNGARQPSTKTSIDPGVGMTSSRPQGRMLSDIRNVPDSSHEARNRVLGHAESQRDLRPERLGGSRFGSTGDVTSKRRLTGSDRSFPEANLIPPYVDERKHSPQEVVTLSLNRAAELCKQPGFPMLSFWCTGLPSCGVQDVQRRNDEVVSRMKGYLGVSAIRFESIGIGNMHAVASFHPTDGNSISLGNGALFLFKGRLIELHAFASDAFILYKGSHRSIVHDLEKLCRASRISIAPGLSPLAQGWNRMLLVKNDPNVFVKILALDGCHINSFRADFSVSVNEHLTCCIANNMSTMGLGLWHVHSFDASKEDLIHATRTMEKANLDISVIGSAGWSEVSGKSCGSLLKLISMSGTVGRGSRQPMRFIIRDFSFGSGALRRVRDGFPPDSRVSLGLQQASGLREPAGGARKYHASMRHGFGNDGGSSGFADRPRGSGELASSRGRDERISADPRKGRLERPSPLPPFSGHDLGKRYTPRTSEASPTEGTGGAKRIAAPSGTSRGFQASPVTPSPGEYVSGGKPAKVEAPNPALPHIAARVRDLDDKGAIASLLDRQIPGSFEEFLKTLRGKTHASVIEGLTVTRTAQILPRTHHVWTGAVFMEGKLDIGVSKLEPANSSGSCDRGVPKFPALCHGFVVVKRRQTDADVKAAIAMLPSDINLKFRIPRQCKKHTHLLNPDAVVFMVRSRGDLDSEESGRMTLSHRCGDGTTELSTSAMDSQKNLLGILVQLRDKQRLGLYKYTLKGHSKRALVVVPPSNEAFEMLGVPWQFRDMAGHDTLMIVVGPSDKPGPRSSK